MGNGRNEGKKLFAGRCKVSGGRREHTRGYAQPHAVNSAATSSRHATTV